MSDEFRRLILVWGDAASTEWGYAPPSQEWVARIEQRLPPGLRTAIVDAFARGVVVPERGHLFRVAAIGEHKGPYGWFSRSPTTGEPAPNWEYFVQVAEFDRRAAAAQGSSLRVDFEDDL